MARMHNSSQGAFNTLMQSRHGGALRSPLRGEVGAVGGVIPTPELRRQNERQPMRQRQTQKDQDPNRKRFRHLRATLPNIPNIYLEGLAREPVVDENVFFESAAGEPVFAKRLIRLADPSDLKRVRYLRNHGF